MSGQPSGAADREAPGPASLEDELLGPYLLDAAIQVRSGGSLPVLRPPWPKAQPQEIDGRVSEWLRTGEMERLARLLQNIPAALAHPAVSHAIFRLRRLAEGAEEARVVGSVWIDDEEISADICSAAQRVLLRMASAVPRGLLPDTEWTIKRTRPRGRPRRSFADRYKAEEILAEYEVMLDHLNTHRSAYRRMRGEPKAVWLDRLSTGIRQAWLQSSMSAPVDYKVSSPRLPLPESVVLRCTRQVVELVKEGRPFLDHIAYTLVGQGTRREPASVRHLVQVARRQKGV